MWGGIALTAITYFAVFKGLSGSVLVTESMMSYLEANMGTALLYTIVGWTVFMGILQHVFRVNILKTIVLAGTAALAMAFAGNDLVNFIGVFMAGFDSFKIAQGVAASGGNVEAMHMGVLSEPVVAHVGWLLGAGVIMVLALWFSKKSRTVTETEVNLSRKGEGLERFSSSPLSRSIVRNSLNISRSINKFTPQRVKNFIDKQFIPVELENNASFDLIHASVNLTLSAMLISLGTSLKLPLSTTYVTFMVAMGASLADRAWGRESAVYRINGVLTVVAGWLLTAFVAFTAAFLVGLFLMWGGKIAIAAMVILVVFILHKSGRLHTKRKDKELQQQQILSTEAELVTATNKEVHRVMEKTLSICRRTIEGLKNEDRKVSKKAMVEANELYEKFKDKRDYEVVPTLESIQVNALEVEQEYVQLVDYSYEITKALKAMTEATFRYIDNNHTAFSDEQVNDLSTIYKTLSEVYTGYAAMEKTGDYARFNLVTSLRESILDLIPKMTKRQIKRVKEGESSTRSSILFLNIVNESKIITLQSSNLMKSHRNFKEQYNKSKSNINPKGVHSIITS